MHQKLQLVVHDLQLTPVHHKLQLVVHHMSHGMWAAVRCRWCVVLQVMLMFVMLMFVLLCCAADDVLLCAVSCVLQVAGCVQWVVCSELCADVRCVLQVAGCVQWGAVSCVQCEMLCCCVQWVVCCRLCAVSCVQWVVCRCEMLCCRCCCVQWVVCRCEMLCCCVVLQMMCCCVQWVVCCRLQVVCSELCAVRLQVVCSELCAVSCVQMWDVVLLCCAADDVLLCAVSLCAVVVCLFWARTSQPFGLACALKIKIYHNPTGCGKEIKTEETYATTK